MSSAAPIALFVYNRPMHTRRTVEALSRNTLAADSDLFIFSDAPKRPEAASGVGAVRAYLAGVRGFRSVQLIEHAQNKGLATSIAAGVTQLCESRGRVIVMEDDLETSPYFLEFMNTALDRYAANDEVMQIAGYMFENSCGFEEDALFLDFVSSWGWATWDRAWRHYDPAAKGYPQLCADASMRRRFDLQGNYKYFRMLKAQQEGKVDSWAIRWYLSVFLRNGLTLYPSRTLVRNLGFDGSGVNCATSEFQQADLDDGFRVQRYPATTAVSPHVRCVYEALPRPAVNLRTLWTRGWNKLRGMLPAGPGAP